MVKFGDNLYKFLMLIFTFLVAMTDYFCCGAPESYEGLCPSDIVLITLLEPSNKAKFWFDSTLVEKNLVKKRKFESAVGGAWVNISSWLHKLLLGNTSGH